MKNISDVVFLRKLKNRYPDTSEFPLKALQDACDRKSVSDLHMIVSICLKLRLYSISMTSLLCCLMKLGWHREHSGLLHILGAIKSDESIDCVYHTALHTFDYMDYSQSYSIKAECVMILGSIASRKAEEKLKQLAVSKDPLIRYHALRQLSS